MATKLKPRIPRTIRVDIKDSGTFRLVDAYTLSGAIAYVAAATITARNANVQDGIEAQAKGIKIEDAVTPVVGEQERLVS